MFRASYQLPNIFGSDEFPTEMQPPTTVRVYVDPHLMADGADAQTAAAQLVASQQGRLSQFLQASRQAAMAAGSTGMTRQLAIDGIRAHYSRNFNQETFTLYVTPSSTSGTQSTPLTIDIRSDFIKWPIPGSQSYGDPPPNWAFNHEPAIIDGNGQQAFFSWYDPAFTPTGREPPTSAPPTQATTGSQVTTTYDQHTYHEDTPDLNPADAGGYVESMWLRDIGGTGFYDKLLEGKQYWEVEVMRLPTEAPTPQTFTLPFPDDGTVYEDPAVRVTPSGYTMKYPLALNTFLNPVVGVIPKHWFEPFTPPAKAGKHTAEELKTAPQVPPRDTARFTHKIIGLDPDLTEPRSIGAVRSSTVMGDEVSSTYRNATTLYTVTIPSSFWPLFWESSTASDVYDNRVPPHYYATNSIPSGWDQFGSSSSLAFFLCAMNIYWDVIPLPAVRGTQGVFEFEFMSAGGDIYQIVDYNALNQAREATGTPSPLHGPWTIPKGGPPAGFVAPGAPAKQYPVGVAGAPYFRCIASMGLGSSTGSWYGPAYPWITAGPRYDDPGSSFPTAGAVTEVRNGVAVPSTTITGDYTPAGTLSSTFPNQMFGDFLRQPDPIAGVRQRREVVVPFHASPGKTMPVIKGRGDNITAYRDMLTTDSNYNPHAANAGFDTGVDLGDPKVGDRIGIATDTKTGKIYFSINGVWKGPDGAACDPAAGIGHAALMDRKRSDITGLLKDAEYYAACSYKFGPTWLRMHLGSGLKHKAPQGFDLLGLSKRG